MKRTIDHSYSMKTCVSALILGSACLFLNSQLRAETMSASSATIVFDLPVGHQELKKLKAIHKQFLVLQKKQADVQEWEKFTKKVKLELPQIVKDLEEVASSKYPHLQHMLWATKDYLPWMLKNARTKSSRDQEKFEAHLKEAERIFSKLSQFRNDSSDE